LENGTRSATRLRLGETMNTSTTPCTTTWPVNWSGVFAGALSALAAALITGLAAIAVGAQMVGHGEHIVSWNRVHFSGIAFAVCGAFFSFVIGGWVAGKITGYVRPESTMLHAALAWTVAVPMILIFAALGGGGYFGGWYGGLGGSPFWANAALPAADAAVIVRNNALGALTSLLLGLIGSVLGGWMASGHSMSWHAFRSEHHATDTMIQGTPAVHMP
jgi:hypothetical protein